MIINRYNKIIARHKQRRGNMPQYVIEREIAGAGDLTSDDLKGISQKSCGILKDMGTGIEWVQSYVTGLSLIHI